jgi:GT2 family glycosyltransferase
LEVVVVDNGSSDAAPDMVARRFPKVRLLCNRDNRGFAAANNQAAAAARGRFLFFLNNDTVVPPRAIRHLLDYLRAHPDVGVIGPRLRDGRGRPQLSARGRPTLAALMHRVSYLRRTGLFRAAYRRFRGRDGDFTTIRSVEVLMGAALLMRRRTFRECGPWDESFTFGGEDVDLCARVAKRYRVVYYPAVELTHFGRSSSRQRAEYAHLHTVVGITRCLRQTGTPAIGVIAYKLAVTLDLPIQWLAYAARYGWRRVCGRPFKARQSLRALQATGHFIIRGLIPFWRA